MSIARPDDMVVEGKEGEVLRLYVLTSYGTHVVKFRREGEGAVPSMCSHGCHAVRRLARSFDRSHG